MREALPQRPLADVVDLVNDKIVAGKDPAARYVGLENLVSGSPDLGGWSPAATSISTNGVFREGDTLFGKLRPNLRKCVLAPFDGYCSTDILVLRAREGFAPRFASRVLQSSEVFDSAVLTAIGTKMPRTSWHALRHRTVFAPPLPEQRQIAAILDTLDDAIRKTGQIIAKLKQVKQGLLHDLLTRGIDDNGELRDPERHPEQFKESPLGRIPKAWTTCPLGELVLRAVYGISESLHSGPGVPVLRMMNLRDGEAELSDLKYSRSQAARDLLLRPGDVLFNRTNSIDHVGRTGIWRGQIEHASFASYLVRMDVDPERLDPEFLNAWLNWSLTQQRIRRFATPGVHQVNINPSNLRRTTCAVPMSLTEQREAVRRLAAVSSRARRDEDALNKLHELRAGLMEDLLTGHVRVTPLLENSSP